MHVRWGPGAAHVCGERDRASWAEGTGIETVLALGVRVPKVQEGFIPFHAPGELSITMKEMLRTAGNG